MPTDEPSTTLHLIAETEEKTGEKPDKTNEKPQVSGETLTEIDHSDRLISHAIPELMEHIISIQRASWGPRTTLTQMHIVTHLAALSPQSATVAELVENLGMKESTVRAQIERMVEEGYLDSVRDEDDHRVFHYTYSRSPLPTGNRQAVAEHIADWCRAHLGELIEGGYWDVSDAELEQFVTPMVEGVRESLLALLRTRREDDRRVHQEKLKDGVHTPALWDDR